METVIYNKLGKKVSDYNLDESLFGLPWNADLIYQVKTALEENARPTVAHTKGRGEVRGGGKKPWKQKGTGRARHGSSRSPIWKGGGVTHGPSKEKKFGQKINKKMKTKALYVALSQKFKDGLIVFVDSLDLKTPKTKAAAITLQALAKVTKAETLAYKRGRRALVVIPSASEAVKKSFRNLPSALTVSAADLNMLNVLTYKHLVIVDPEQTLAKIKSRSAKK
ncbi:MAG: 50S ribosomal protein L4 [bacterium]|nr:50S ribosomal protein L4 [bacterium]